MPIVGALALYLDFINLFPLHAPVHWDTAAILGACEFEPFHLPRRGARSGAGAGVPGIWREVAEARDEIAALRRRPGHALIDTAEMYGDGAAEPLVAEAIDARRGEVFLVSKVFPQNASSQGTIAACEASLRP